MRKLIITSLFLTTALMFGARVMPVAATDTLPAETFTPEVPLPGVFEGEQDADDTLLSRYIRAIFIYFIWTVGILATVMVIYGGLRWVSAAGNPAQIKEARDIIDNAIIGVIIGLVSVVLLNIINPKLTTLELPTLSSIKEESLCLKRTYSNHYICKGSIEVPCGEAQDVDVSNRETGELTTYTCYGTFCPRQNNLNSICMMVDTAGGYQATCVTGVPVENTDNKCTVTNITSIPVTSDVADQRVYTFTGDIFTGSGGFGTEYIGNYCKTPNGAPRFNGFIIGEPNAQVLLPKRDAVAGSPTSFSRLHGRGCPDWDNDLKIETLLLP